MTKEQKIQAVEILTQQLENNKNIYLADIGGLDAEKTSALRRLCFNKGVEITVVKNTLLKKAMDNSSKDFDAMYDTLVGNTSMLMSETANAPAKVIKEFLKKKNEKPVFKAAYVEESVYVGVQELDALENLKSKEELIGDIIGLLQSPAKNVVSALQSGGNTLSGLVKTLSER